ncbi:hypothetical protein [Methanosarcina sp.]|uniref:hypothetical protein n=1 Tax=Methanosarcina sp. TaxID=2213 RepID=UPI003C784F96
MSERSERKGQRPPEAQFGERKGQRPPEAQLCRAAIRGVIPKRNPAAIVKLIKKELIITV